MKKITFLIVLINILAYSQKDQVTKKDSIMINKRGLSNKPKDQPDDFKFVNAVNFDFTDTSKTSANYFGQLNYFFNLKKEDFISNFYVNTGLMKLSYYSSLNKSTLYDSENVLENPLKSDAGSNYNRLYNKYEYDVKLNSFSAYAQLFYKFPNAKYNYLFYHLHTELLITSLESNLIITNIQTESDVISSINIFPIKPYLEKNKTDTKQFVGAYFGLGITVKPNFKLKKTKINCFFQATTGLSNTKLSEQLTTFKKNKTNNFESKKDNNGFFIIHSYFENNLTGVNLVIGTQIRGDYITQPLYMFYVGLNTNLENLADLLK